MSEEKILKHYRYGGKLTHSGCEVLPNMKPIDVTITKIEYKENEFVNGKNQPAWVATTKELDLPIILNSINRKRLVRLTNTEYPETVSNFVVTLCAEKTRDPSDGGGTTMGLRISKIPAKQPGNATKKILLDVDSPVFNSAKAFLSEPGNTIEMIIEKYDLSENAKIELDKILK